MLPLEYCWENIAQKYFEKGGALERRERWHMCHTIALILSEYSYSGVHKEFIEQHPHFRKYRDDMMAYIKELIPGVESDT